MCKVKSCVRPAFLGGQCGFHAMQAWAPAARAPGAGGGALHDGAAPRRSRTAWRGDARRQAPRPVSG